MSVRMRQFASGVYVVEYGQVKTSRRKPRKRIAHHEQWRTAEQLSFEFESFEQRLRTTYERLVDQGVKL